MFGAIIFIPLFLQLVYGVQPDELRPAHAAAHGRPARREHRLGAGHQPRGALQGLPHRRHRGHDPRHAPALPPRGRHRAVAGVGLHARGRHRHRARHAGARARRPERRAGARHRRRDVHGARSSAPWAGRSAWRCSAPIFASRLADELSARCPRRSPRGFSAAGSNISPAEVHALPPVVRDDFLLAFVDALQPVFVVGAALTAVAFALSWRLREVPLRASVYETAEHGVAHPAARTGLSSDRLMPSRARTSRAARRCRDGSPRCCAGWTASSGSRAARSTRRTTRGCRPTGSRRTTADTRTRPPGRSAAGSEAVDVRHPSE